MADYQGHKHIPVDDLSAYADGQIADSAQRQQIEQHLQDCAECRDELHQLQAISQLLADLPEPELPRSFRLTPDDVPVSATPAPIEPWIVRQQAVFRVAAMAAVLLLALVVTIDVLPQRSGDDSDDVSVMTDAPQQESAPESDDPGAGIMGADEEETEEDQEVPEEMPAVESDEEAAGDQDEAAGESEEEMPGSESEADVAEDSAEEDAADGDDAGERAAEQEESAAEPDQESEPAEDGSTDLMATEQEDDGMSTLRIVAIGLGVISVALLIVGFVIPRWWSSSASRS